MLYDTYTSASQLSKYERVVSIVEKLENVHSHNKASEEIMNNIYKGITKITSFQSNSITFTSSVYIKIWQAFLAASPWLLFCLLFVPSYFKGGSDDAPSIIGGTLVLALTIGGIGYFLPIEWAAWIRLGAYPFGANFVIFILLMIYGNRKGNSSMS